jgi:hypothetical protein
VSLKDVGWVWEGIALDPGVEPSIYGVGEGARYFGLARACFMFHRNNEVAMEKMRWLDEVVCDITKWGWREVEDPAGGVAFKHSVSGDPEVTRSEAEHVSRLSQAFPNITGGFIDDMSNLINRHGYTPERHEEVRASLKRHDDALRLWAVVYSHELDAEYWRPYAGAIDVVNLWVWNAPDLRSLDQYVERCRAIFGEKPLVLGCYLRDYPTRSPVPLDLLEFEFERIEAYLGDGRIDGFSILAACLIDQHPEQAAWIRDFLARR